MQITSVPDRQSGYSHVTFSGAEMKHRVPMLRVKIKSLAEESRIIRKEEGRCKHHREDLRCHRVVDVRRESRAAQLAYGFIRGRSYQQLEDHCHTPPDWDRVERLVAKYGVCRDWMEGESMRDFESRIDDQKCRFHEWRRMELVSA